MTADRTTLDLLIAQIPTGMILVDESGEILQINRAAAELFGRQREDAMGCAVTELHPGLRDVTMPAQRAEVAVEVDGEQMVVGYTTTSLAEGAGVVIALSDITAFKAREAAAERGRRLADLGRIVGTVAHEIRNPVFAISSLLQVMRDEPSVARDPEVLDICDKTLGEVARIQRLVDDLVTLGRPRPAEIERFDLLEELERLREDMVSALPPLEDGHRAEPTVDASPEVQANPEVEGDRDALRCIVAGLLRNAWRAIKEASGEAGTRITMGVERFDRDLVLTVTDHGQPLDPSELARVFEPFLRRGPYGSGLALTIVQQRVRRLGGIVSVRSSAEQGTIFRVVLPSWWPS